RTIVQHVTPRQDLGRHAGRSQRLRRTVAVGNDQTLGHPSTSRAIWGYALIRNPDARRELAGLPEHVDRHPAAGEEIGTDSQPPRRQELVELLADGHSAFLMESAVIAEAVKVKLEGLGFHQPASWDIIDHNDGKIWLAGNRAHHGELRHGE